MIGTGAEDARRWLDRVIEDAVIGDDVDHDIGADADWFDIQRLPYELRASLVAIERPSGVAAEGSDPLGGGCQRVDRTGWTPVGN